MVVKLMVGQLINPKDDEGAPKNDLEVRKHEDDEDEPFEVQLTIGPDA